MEPLNVSLKNIIQFVLCVQDACDQHRKLMEHFWLQEYTSYIAEWKQNQAECKSQFEKKNEVKSHNAKISQIRSYECCEDLEFTLADSLLRKARNLRFKNQKLINGLSDCNNISISFNDTAMVAPKCSDSSRTSSKNQIEKKLYHSKSDFIIKSHRSTVVPRSKSATIPFVPKGNTETFHINKSCTSLLPKCDSVKHIKVKSKESGDSAVISSKDLDKLKNLHVNFPSCHESKESKKTPSSDASVRENQHQISSHPSSTEFLNLMKGRLNAVSSHVKLKIWYPFLSSKSEAFLTTVNCNTFSSIKKVYSILYSIQETMMWIDLLHLLETEICPSLTFDANDVNMLRICSYLRSIFHPTSQRVPILDPNR